MHVRLLAISTTALLATGCAATLSTMDTARTVDPGHVRANIAMGVYVPAKPVLAVMDAADIAKDKFKSGNATLTPQEAEDLYEAGLAGLLTPPAVMNEVMVRTGIVENLDVGLRLATTSVRLDAKFRFLHAEDGLKSHHASIGLGGSKYLFKGTAFDLAEIVKIDDFSRWDVEVPLLYTYDYGDFLSLYGGAKYIYTTFSLDPNLYDLQQKVASTSGQPPITDKIDSSMHFFGGIAGIAAGYKYAFLLLELNAGYTYSRPAVYSFVDGKTKERDIGGLTLYPSIGFALKI